MNKKTCANCRLFKKKISMTKELQGELYEPTSTLYLGECHAHAPNPMRPFTDDNGKWQTPEVREEREHAWPVIWSDEFCGEWKKKE